MAALAVLPCLVWWPEAAGERSFAYFDISSFNLPARAWGAEQLRHGEFPLWCRGWGTGFPYLAESQNGICYPPNWLLYSTLPPWQACNIALLIHLAWAGIGAYALFRRHASVGGALLGAALFQIGGRLLTHQIHTSIVETIAWWPWQLAALEAWALGGRRRWLAAAALAGGLQLLAGSLQAAVWCQLGVAVAALAWVAADLRQAGRMLAGVAVAGALAACLAAPLLLPAAELLFGQSFRAGGLAAEQADWGIGGPPAWATLAAPALFGHPAFGNAWLEGPLPWREMPLYHGIWAVPLAAAGLAGRRRRGAWMFFVLVAVGLVLAAGPLHPLHDAVRSLPVLASLRNPVRYLLLSGLGLCGLAAIGWDNLRHGRNSGRWLWAGGIAIALVAAGAAARAYDGLHDWGTPSGEAALAVRQELAATGFGARLEKTVWSRAVAPAAALAVGLMALLARRRWPRAAMLVWGLAMVGELGWHARNEWPTLPPSFHDDPPLLRTLREQAAAVGEPPRVFLAEFPRAVSATGWAIDPSRLLAAGECLYWERGLLFDVGSVNFESRLPLQLERCRLFEERLSGHPHLLRLMGLRWAMTPQPLAWDQLGPPIARGVGAVLQTVRDPAGFAYIAAATENVAPAAVWDRLAAAPADPRQRLLVEAPAGAEIPPSAGYRAATAEWLGPNRLRVTLAAPAEGVLTVRESWYPGWTATVDGAAVPIWPADGLFLAVPLPLAAEPAQPRVVEFAFRSVWFERGLAIAAVAVIGIAALAWPTGRRDDVAAAGQRPPTIAWWAIAILAGGGFAMSAVARPEAWSRAFPTLAQAWRGLEPAAPPDPAAANPR